MAAMSEADINNKKDFWIEIDFTQVHQVYQVILKKRNKDMNPADNVNPTIWIQYQDPADNRWRWYAHNNGVLKTGETADTDPEFETKINLIPFSAKGVVIWFPYNKDHP